MDDRRRPATRAGCRCSHAADASRPPGSRASCCAPTARGSGAPGARGSRSACRSPPGPRPASRRRGSRRARRRAPRPSGAGPRRVSSSAGHLAGDDVAVDLLHDVERRADHRLVVARRRAPPARARWPATALQHARLAQHVVGARAAAAPRGGRRRTNSRVAAASRRSVTFEWPVADRRDLGLAVAEARARRGTPRSGSVTSSGSRSLAAASSRVRTMSSGAIVRRHQARSPVAALVRLALHRELEQLAGDRHAVHLAGAVVDPRGARVRVERRDRQVHRDARGAVDLHGAVDDRGRTPRETNVLVIATSWRWGRPCSTFQAVWRTISRDA